MDIPRSFPAIASAPHATDPDCWCQPTLIHAHGQTVLYHRDAIGIAFELGVDLVAVLKRFGS